jgi:hypothetical protein
MRSFKDYEGRIAWIFDEKTHPQGNENPNNIQKVVVPVKKVEVKKDEPVKKRK